MLTKFGDWDSLVRVTVWVDAKALRTQAKIPNDFRLFDCDLTTNPCKALELHGFKVIELLTHSDLPDFVLEFDSIPSEKTMQQVIEVLMDTMIPIVQNNYQGFIAAEKEEAMEIAAWNDSKGVKN